MVLKNDNRVMYNTKYLCYYIFYIDIMVALIIKLQNIWFHLTHKTCVTSKVYVVNRCSKFYNEKALHGIIIKKCSAICFGTILSSSSQQKGDRYTFNKPFIVNGRRTFCIQISWIREIASII